MKPIIFAPIFASCILAMPAYAQPVPGAPTGGYQRCLASGQTADECHRRGKAIAAGTLNADKNYGLSPKKVNREAVREKCKRQGLDPNQC